MDDMKKKIQGCVALLVASFFTIAAHAQSNDKWRMELNYNVSIPTGSFKTNEVGTTSFRGVSGGINYNFNPKFSLGLNVGFQSYYEKLDRQLYKGEGNQTISAVRTNLIDIMPVLLKATYFPIAGTSNSKLQPYLSAGAGVNMVNYQQFYGEFGGSEYAVPLALQAGAGVAVPLGVSGTTSLKLGATYNYSGYTKNDVNTKLGNVGVNVGLVFPFK
jgi:long-subunit fatty acid transport protein